jgi:hypothetical protein
MAIWDPQWPREFEVVPQRLYVIRFDSAGNPTDTIATLPFGTQRRLPAEVPAVWRGLFEPQGVFTVSGTRLYVTDAEQPEVRVWSDDRLIQVIRWYPPDRSVRPGDEDAGRQEFEEDFPPTLRDQLRPGFAALPAPAVYPAVSDIHAGPAGELWVRRYPSPTIDVVTWWSFGIDGGFRCALTVPRGSTIFEFGAENAVIKGTTALGEEYVDVIAIRP